MSLSDILRNRIDVYTKAETTNLLGEKEYNYTKLKSVWAEITVGASGSGVKDGEAKIVYADVSHKIVVRTKSIPSLSNDMYFIYKGQRYDIKYFEPNYKYQDSINILCSLVVE